MKVTGDVTVGAPAESVRAALRDADTLARLIPGCEELQVTSAGKCWLTVTTDLPGVDGTYSGEATVHERLPPGVLAADLSVAGVQGTIAAKLSVRLAPQGEAATQFSYDVDAELDGAIAGVGKRMLASIVKRLAGEFTGALDSELTSVPAVAAPADILPAQANPAETPPSPEASPLTRTPQARAPESAERSRRTWPPRAGERRTGGRKADRGALGTSDFDSARTGAHVAEATGAGPGMPREHNGLPGWPGAMTGLLVGGAVAAAGIAIGAYLGRRRRSGTR
jgi:uncharacterized protein